VPVRSFIFANVTEADIILRAEIDALAERHSNFKRYYTLDKPADDWKMGRGYV
jgi:cytochrome-b5 reductase